ncbi:MAG: endonuclease domain-containing protein [Pseudomonadota bacterium]|nr:endonuclease domain-containing protein [Pseudomonadota bacterium]
MRRPDPDEAASLTRVREARRDSTPAERKLWSRLRSRQLNGAKFRRQVWLGPFIADFFCAEARLIVEVDGDSHAAQMAYDERRTNWLAGEGFRVVRVTNRDVMHNLDGVLQHIAAALPSPSQP